MGIYIQKYGHLGQKYFELDEMRHTPHSGDCIKVLNRKNGKEKTYVVINEDLGSILLHTREVVPRVRYRLCEEKHLDNIYMFSISALLDRERWILRIYDSFDVERNGRNRYCKRSFVDTLDRDVTITLLIGKYKREDHFNIKTPYELTK